jgi:hypothetical protein
MWERAIEADPQFVRYKTVFSCNYAYLIVQSNSITSFNEWGEGTQIEPAVAFSSTGGSISDYEVYHIGPDTYVMLTEEFTLKFKYPKQEGEL